MSLKIYNTLTKTKEEFIPLEKGKVKMYACGVTVYDDCHIGHARSAIVFDVIRRYLEKIGYKVKYVRNFTDVDDKIINRANKDNKKPEEITEKYIKSYYEDMEALGIKRANIEPKATEHIKEMIDLIADLAKKGYAYEINGDVYFEVRKFAGYGKLSGRSLDELQAGARVEVNEQKKDPLDFALWKKSKPGEPWWDSPWGKGRPGWHIECSAMCKKHLGDTLDIHAGGMDLIFPHHENEIAQSEASTGKQFVRYWMHNGFVNINQEKMSKSLGNFFTIKDILKKYNAEAVRFFLISTHYRSPIDFSDKELEMAGNSLHRVSNTLYNIEDSLEGNIVTTSLRDDEFLGKIEKYKNAFFEAMDDDFNTAKALAAIFELSKETNIFVEANPSKKGLEEAQKQIKELGKVLGLWQKDPEGFFVNVETSEEAEKLSKKFGASTKTIKPTALCSLWNNLFPNELIPLDSDDNQIKKLIEAKRDNARKNKDFTTSDRIRDELKKIRIVIEDTKHGTRWKRE